MRYMATINTPGYLPDADDRPTFETAQEAWSYLWERRHADLSEADDGTADDPFAVDSDCLDAISTVAANQWPGARTKNGVSENGVGTITGPTPGYQGDHDLGLAYSVTAVIEDRPDLAGNWFDHTERGGE